MEEMIAINDLEPGQIATIGMPWIAIRMPWIKHTSGMNEIWIHEVTETSWLGRRYAFGWVWAYYANPACWVASHSHGLVETLPINRSQLTEEMLISADELGIWDLCKTQREKT